MSKEVAKLCPRGGKGSRGGEDMRRREEQKIREEGERGNASVSLITVSPPDAAA